MYLPTLLTTLALLTLTATATPLAIPDAKAPAPQNPIMFTLHDTKTGGCKLQLHDIFAKCNVKVNVDKKHKCADLPRGQYYQGNACKNKNVKGGKYKGLPATKQGHWIVSTMSPGVSLTFSDGKGSSVSCNRDSPKDLVC